ncbi:MAG: tRNA pseudouridine(55) synthase TruB [Cytophagales bacterium]
MSDFLQKYEDGQVILIDKPQSWTSFDVVNKLRYALKVKKLGHAGTLDPLATGLLILCSGKFTKKIDEYQAQEKEYVGEMILGKTTPSYDSETEVNGEFHIDHINIETIHEASTSFLGEISQIPPMYSAIKKDGQRMYDLARQGKTIELEPRKVTVTTFEITKIDIPKVEFRVVCSKGTYIRSLVHDLGKKLNSGAYMSALRRTRIGAFRVENAQSVANFIDQIKEMGSKNA